MNFISRLIATLKEKPFYLLDLLLFPGIPMFVSFIWWYILGGTIGTLFVGPNYEAQLFAIPFFIVGTMRYIYVERQIKRNRTKK